MTSSPNTGYKGLQAVAQRSVPTNRYLHRSIRRCQASTNFGDAPDDRGVKVASATLFANADRYLFQHNESVLVTKRLTVDW